jgi:hypothetical protein
VGLLNSPVYPIGALFLGATVLAAIVAWLAVKDLEDSRTGIGRLRRAVDVITIPLIVLAALFGFAVVGHWLTTPREPPQEVDDTPVDYELPASALITEEHATSADFFGDYTYCAVFTLPASQMGALSEKGFDWIVSDPWELPEDERSQWITGRLPSQAQGWLGSCLHDPPEGEATYLYLYKEYQDDVRALAIEEKGGRVYYFRSSW